MLGLGTLAKKVFGTPNDRKVKSVRPLVAAINALEPDFRALSDDGIKERTQALAMRAQGGESLDSLLPEAFANCREAARRALGLRAFDVQMQVVSAMMGSLSATQINQLAQVSASAIAGLESLED